LLGSAKYVDAAQYHDAFASLGDGGLDHVSCTLDRDSRRIVAAASICKMKHQPHTLERVSDLPGIQQVDARHRDGEPGNRRTRPVASHRNNNALDAFLIQPPNQIRPDEPGSSSHADEATSRHLPGAGDTRRLRLREPPPLPVCPLNYGRCSRRRLRPDSRSRATLYRLAEFM